MPLVSSSVYTPTQNGLTSCTKELQPIFSVTLISCIDKESVISEVIKCWWKPCDEELLSIVAMALCRTLATHVPPHYSNIIQCPSPNHPLL